MLIIWDSLEVEVWSTVSQDHMLQIHGRFIQSNEEFYVFNIYAPCDGRAKQELWEALSVRLQVLRGEKICVCGDFNAVQCPEERMSLRGGAYVNDVHLFSMFIDNNDLLDLPLCGRRFTWYKGDGTSMSMIDNFLFFEDWWLQWPNCIQVALLRGLSDHCPLQLSVDEENWGPRPVRMLKC
jgi:hypothetical protein